MKECGNCFRYIEDWRDAKEKGLKPRQYTIGEYFYKPRTGVKPKGLGINCPDPIKPGMDTCKHYQSRMAKNIVIWNEKVRDVLQQKFYRFIRVPIGKMRKPLPIVDFEDSFNGMTDTVEKDAIPLCPHCKEWAYVTDAQRHCPFCGQRYLIEKESIDERKIVVPEQITSLKDGQCPKCGHHAYGYNDLPMQCSNCEWVQDTDQAKATAERLNKIFDEIFLEESEE